MKNSQKGFIVPLLLGIIALLIIGGGAYIYYNQPKAQPQSTAEENTGPLPALRNFKDEISSSSVTSSQNSTSVSYTSFDGKSYNLYPTSGRNMVFLRADPNADLPTISKMLAALDNAYDYYKQTTGKTPGLYVNYNNLDSIAVVPSSQCGGAACSYLGMTGTEVTTPSYKDLYQDVLNNNQYDQALFYELGRTFWFYNNKIEYKGSDSTGTIATGYAVLMRFFAMDAAGIRGGPWHGIPFETFRQDVKGMVDLYTANASYNWSNTLKVGVGPINAYGLGATDLFASFIYRLADVNGGSSYIKKLWKSVDIQPDAVTTQDAVDNFVVAASQAAGDNLSDVFVKLWKWPVSQSALNKLSLLGNPVSIAPYSNSNFKITK